MDLQKSISILYIGYLVPFSVLIPLLLSFYKYTRLSGSLKILSGYLVVSLLSSCVVVALASNGINNMLMMHIYTLVEFGMLCVFFLKVLNNMGMKMFIYLSIILFIALFIVDIFRWDKLHGFNTYSKSAEALFITVFSLLYFIQSLNMDILRIERETSTTYVVSGLLLYFSSSLALFATLHLNPQVSEQLIIWNLHATLLLFMFILFFAGLWKHR